jgi:hypothetical protein
MPLGGPLLLLAWLEDHGPQKFKTGGGEKREAIHEN